MSALMVATNIAYAEAEEHGFVKQTVLSLTFILAAVIGLLLVLAVGVVLPLAWKVLGTSAWVQLIIGALRWIVFWGFAVLAISALSACAIARVRAVTLGDLGLDGYSNPVGARRAAISEKGVLLQSGRSRKTRLVS